ncbi:MAG TPA: MTH938/NDUFAF3 family protein [Caulobacteraceae bacterium]
MRQPPAIDGYGAGGFRVAGVWRPGSLLILEDAPRDWRPARFADLQAADFDAVIAAAPGLVEFVLLGTGPAQALPPRAVRDTLRAAGLGLEFMATEAAARLHNVLASEGRLFATALIAV